jgi:hypothetical protein
VPGIRRANVRAGCWPGSSTPACFASRSRQIAFRSTAGRIANSPQLDVVAAEAPPMNKSAFAALALATVLAGACTWVKPTSGGDAVRVAYDGNVSGCRDAGAISVSVTDKVAFYQRSDLKVRDELETLARNQAADIPADTVKPNSEPRDGAQQFEAYVCGRLQVRERGAKPLPPPAGVETYPIKDH